MAIRVGGTIRIVDKKEDLHSRLLQHLAPILNKALRKALPGIRKELKSKVDRIFRFPNVYDALVNGPLDKIFGLHKGTAKARAETIIKTIVQNMSVELKPVKKNNLGLQGGIQVGLLLDDFSDVLSLPEAKVVDPDYELPWLQWLLIEGDKIIITDHDVKFGTFRGSRSGGAIMVESAVGWRVPPQYSGVIGDNWLTRSIDRGMIFLQSIFDSIVEKHIGLALNVVP